jgi:hypothetical protein
MERIEECLKKSETIGQTLPTWLRYTEGTTSQVNGQPKRAMSGRFRSLDASTFLARAHLKPTYLDSKG